MMNVIEVSWTALKSSMQSKGIASRLQWVQEKDRYELYLFDGPLVLHTIIKITNPKNADQHDFEASFKTISNQVLDPVDDDNSQLSRVKITKSGWNFQLHFVEFETSKKDSIVSEDENGTPLGFSTLKFYDENNGELTEQGAIDTDCVKTVLDWEPTHDYEIKGGFLKQKSIPPSPVRVHVIGVPDVPPAYGGNKKFTQGGLNLEYFGADEMVDADGEAPKFLKFDSNVHSNKLRVSTRHGTGVKHKMAMIFKLFVA